MGNYFYIYKKLTEEEKNGLWKAIENNLISDLHQKVNKLNDEKICFGELDKNQQFLFYHNKFKYYSPTKESINNFLSDPNKIIIDSQNKVYTPEEIWKIVDDNADKMNNQQIIEQKATEYEIASYLADEATMILAKPIVQYRPRFCEFYNDGLRFYSMI